MRIPLKLYLQYRDSRNIISRRGRKGGKPYPLDKGCSIASALEYALLQLLPVVEAGSAPQKTKELQGRAASVLAIPQGGVLKGPSGCSASL